jgi:hypothetical protein
MIKCSLSSGEKGANRCQKKRKKGSIYSIVILGAWILWKHRNFYVFQGARPYMNIMSEYQDEHLWYMAGVRKVISPLRKDLQSAPRLGAPAVFMARGPSHTAQDKRGARWGMGTNFSYAHTVPHKQYLLEPIIERAEARGRPHYITVVVEFSCTDHHCCYVFLLLRSR